MKCPCCGYEDSNCWHYPIFRGCEFPYARIEELREQEPEIAMQLENAPVIRKGVRELVTSKYAYKLNKSGYVRRRDIVMYNTAKWGPILMEKKKRFVPGKQITLLALNDDKPFSECKADNKP